MPKRKNKGLPDAKKKVIHIENYKKEIAELKAVGRENYKPKIGRKIHVLETKIKKAA